MNKYLIMVSLIFLIFNAAGCQRDKVFEELVPADDVCLVDDAGESVDVENFKKNRYRVYVVNSESDLSEPCRVVSHDLIAGYMEDSGLDLTKQTMLVLVHLVSPDICEERVSLFRNIESGKCRLYIETQESNNEEDDLLFQVIMAAYPKFTPKGEIELIRGVGACR